VENREWGVKKEKKEQEIREKNGEILAIGQR